MKFTFNNESFDVSLSGVITPKIRGEVAEILANTEEAKFEKELRTWMLDLLIPVYQGEPLDMLELSDLRERMLEAIQTEKIPTARVTELIKKIGEHKNDIVGRTRSRDRTLIQVFKAAAYLVNIDPRNSTLIHGEPESEFWQNQDVTEMEKEVNSFLAAARLPEFTN
jgi:hypothetical protein